MDLLRSSSSSEPWEVACDDERVPFEFVENLLTMKRTNIGQQTREWSSKCVAFK